MYDENNSTPQEGASQPSKPSGYKPRKNFDNNRSGGGGGYKGGNRAGGGNFGNKPRGNYNNKGPREQAPRSMYYITLLCPTEIDDAIQEHKEMMRTDYACEVAAKSPAHVTLIAPFFLSDGKRNELVEKLNAFESIISDVTVDMNGFGHFGNRVIFADVAVNDNMTALQEQLENYLRNGGFPFIKEAKKPFHPHITVATRDLKEEDFDAAWAKFEGKEISGSYNTNTIHLMKLVEERWVHEEQFVLQ